MFNFWKRSPLSSRYIAGWEIDFKDPEQLTKILLTQGIDEEDKQIFGQLQSATELVISDNKIIETIDHSAGNEPIRKKINVKLPVEDWPTRKLYVLEKDLNGNHVIGGKKPGDLNLPSKEETNVHFVYLGTLDCKDQPLAWTGLDKLHLTYPVFDGAYQIYFDYSEPNHPKILNPEAIDWSWLSEHKEAAEGLEKVWFKETRLRTTKTIDPEHLNEFPYGTHLFGVPMWEQYPEIPRCPKSNQVMRFVGALSSDPAITIEDLHQVKDPSILSFGNHLVFGDMGKMYIFYEPESKILCVFTQFG